MFMMNPQFRKNEITFTINKKIFKVTEDLPADMSLSTFIREYAQLTGTKTMCLEGGCGSCVVAVRSLHSVTQEDIVYAVNSCLVPVFSCHGWDILTVEGLGSQHSGYHHLQLLLASDNGSQCGFCSPGMIMNMFSLMESKQDLTKEDIETSFGGNICRCTGYRPILEAFRKVATDQESQLNCKDIEDMVKVSLNNNNNKNPKKCLSVGSCTARCFFKSPFEETSKEAKLSKSVLVNTSVGKWYRATTKRDIFDIFKNIGEETYRFVAGNTAQGVYRDEGDYQNYIDINGVSELKTYSIIDEKLVVGVNMSLAELMTVLKQVSKSHTKTFDYASTLADHIGLVANVPVRNMATIAGNLFIKKKHPEFPSDLFLLLETVGAQLVLEKEDGKPITMSLLEFLSFSVQKALLTRVIFPPLDESVFVVRTFKIMPRAQNVHAYVNAGFCFKFNKEAKFTVLQTPTIVFGGISSSFIHASATENLLETLSKQGKGLLEEEVLKLSLESLENEIKPEPSLPGADPKYTAGLAVALFYKFMLGLCPEAVAPQYRSGASFLSRPISSSTREFDTDKSVWPLNKPCPKVEGIYQCAGEAKYVADMPKLPGELHATLVLTTTAQGSIVSIDSSQALSIPGVVAFYSAKDIPGVNSFTSGFPDDEPVFCDGKVLYYGQPVGVVLAETESLALKAAQLVSIKYSNKGFPYTDMKKIIQDADNKRIIKQAEITSSNSRDDVEDTVTVRGSIDLHDQYHMTMELQTCICVPIEDGMDVYSSTQWMEHVHNAISKVLDMPAHQINMKVWRLGGGYGAKLTRSTWVGTQCAVAARLSNRPVRLVLPLKTNMEVMGKRYNCFTTYKAIVNKSTGSIMKLEGNLYEDAGWSENDPVVESTLAMLPSAYDSSSWDVKGSIVKTDKPSNTWCRSPAAEYSAPIWLNSVHTKAVDVQLNISGTLMSTPLPWFPMLCNIAPPEIRRQEALLKEFNEIFESLPTIQDLPHQNSRLRSAEAIGTIEVIMDSIASATGLDPVQIRLANMVSSESNPVPSMVKYWIEHTDFEMRLKKIKEFNAENRWKQRGISLVPMTYKLFLASRYNALVTIYAVDGTVAISHGGIECGQGINTKAIQVCAYSLGIDMSLIQVKPTDILISPNNEGTGGSVSSESVCFAVLQCCKTLLKRLEPIRSMLPAGYTWQQLIQKAYSEQVKLSSTYLFTSKDDVKDYDIHGVTVAEVEVDILTGQHQVTRVDVLEDAGKSLSPEIDIGQVEGAFIMGLGYYTLEELQYNREGQLLTNRTWNYYPPGPQDIPIDFRIELQKNVINPLGVLRSKATGEPPLCMSVAVPLAICQALSVPASLAGASPYVQAFKTPLSPEKSFLACNNNISLYKYS